MAKNVQDWHSGVELKIAIDNYANNHAKPPEMKEAKELNTKVMNGIKTHLQTQGIFVNPEFVGSVYEGLKVRGGPVKRDDIEFDIMIVWDFKDAVKTEPTEKPNYALVRFAKHGTDRPACKQFDENGYLSPSLVADYFFGKIQSCVNAMAMDILPRDLKIILKKHGPAIQMDVLRQSSGNLMYSVDIVPSLRLTSEEYYVAKILRLENKEMLLTWRRSYSLDEKRMLLNIDQGNGNRKKVLKVLKMIRNGDSQLGMLTSYHLKNILLRVCDRITDSKLWSDQFVGERLVDLIWELVSCLERRELPCYFQPDVNLFDGMKSEALVNLGNRCKRMCQNKDIMMALLVVPQPTSHYNFKSFSKNLPSNV